MILPYERITYVWNRDLYRLMTGIKSTLHHQNMIMEAIGLYLIVGAGFLWLADSIFAVNSKDISVICILVTLMALYIILYYIHLTLLKVILHC